MMAHNTGQNIGCLQNKKIILITMKHFLAQTVVPWQRRDLHQLTIIFVAYSRHLLRFRLILFGQLYEEDKHRRPDEPLLHFQCFMWNSGKMAIMPLLYLTCQLKNNFYHYTDFPYYQCKYIMHWYVNFLDLVLQNDKKVIVRCSC